MDSTDGETAREVSEVFFNSLEPAEEEVIKIKIFSESSVTKLERSIEKWLKSAGPIVIHHVLQSESASDGLGWSLTISIFYVEPAT